MSASAYGQKRVLVDLTHAERISIDGDYWYVARWNATTQKFEIYVPDAPPVFNDFNTMERGEGYFIAAKTSCTLTYP